MGSPSPRLALTRRSTSAGVDATGSAETDTIGLRCAASGKSHSWVTPTRFRSRPSAKTISVADGRSETIRIGKVCPTRNSPRTLDLYDEAMRTWRARSTAVTGLNELLLAKSVARYGDPKWNTRL